jgi:hypothetical protein
MRPQRLEDLEAWTTAKHVARALHERLAVEASSRHPMLADRMRAAALDCLQNVARALPKARSGPTYELVHEVDQAERDALALHALIALAGELQCLSREHADALLHDVKILERALEKLQRQVSLWADELFGEENGCRIEHLVDGRWEGPP